ncbi:MAG: hypothetical protein JW751_03280 [Polyangiaceae bacterium]|nr:hypothetical protein [Polyangiaceae bacterium]
MCDAFIWYSGDTVIMSFGQSAPTGFAARGGVAGATSAAFAAVVGAGFVLVVEMAGAAAGAVVVSLAPAADVAALLDIAAGGVMVGVVTDRGAPQPPAASIRTSTSEHLRRSRRVALATKG